MPEYRLTLTPKGAYMHAYVEGDRTPENALRYFREVHEACMRAGFMRVLLEMNFTGPSLDTGSIFSVIAERSPTGARFQRMAYVESSAMPIERAQFAETVAQNRGVNVRLFPDVESAARWLESDPGT